MTGYVVAFLTDRADSLTSRRHVSRVTLEFCGSSKAWKVSGSMEGLSSMPAWCHFIEALLPHLDAAVWLEASA